MYFAINTCNDANNSKTYILLYAVTSLRLIAEAHTLGVVLGVCIVMWQLFVYIYMFTMYGNKFA